MAANVNAIYPRVPNVDWGVIDTANTAKDGTGTVVTVFTAGANGSIVERLRGQAKGTNVATVLRVFMNNGGTNATAGNNTLIHEVTCAATTLSEVAALAPVDIIFPLPLKLDAGFKLNITIGTSIAAGMHVTAFGGDY